MVTADSSNTPAKGSLDRREVVATLLQERGDLLVVTGLGSSTYDVAACGENDHNFYLWGAMGSAVTVGLGLAKAQPTRSVAVITGDGEILMGIGALVTCVTQAPDNLTIVVLDNRHYGETGMQASHTGLGVNLHQVAQGIGIKDAREVSDQSGVIELRQQLQQPAALGFATIRIGEGPHERVLPSRDGVANKLRMRSALGIAAGH